MSRELTVLLITAASIGFFHTLLGPDHYIPFIAMARAARWSLTKTTWVTILCGIGHVLSSVVLGLIGIALGMVVTRLEMAEAFRGNLAGWALIAFGLVYFVWGLRQAYRNRPHRHVHAHVEERAHVHEHVHTEDHIHSHERETGANLTPWILFTVFVFGPCEPLIPLLMYPAAKSSVYGLVLVTSVFAVTTISTMLVVVVTSSWGTNLLPLGRLERYTHALAGAIICLCGVSIQFLGL